MKEQIHLQSQIKKNCFKQLKYYKKDKLRK